MRRLTGHQRSAAANRQLGCVLAFVAGAINAGGFLAIGHYTSHMTGVVSSMADNLVLGQGALVLAALAAVTAFLAGAATTALLVNFARRRRLASEYALPLLLEAGLLLLFGVLGTHIVMHDGGALATTAALLCYVMGLQNAVVTKGSSRAAPPASPASLGSAPRAAGRGRGSSRAACPVRCRCR